MKIDNNSSIRRAASIAALGIALLCLPTAQAALIDAGNGMVNDTDQNLVWTKDANLFKTMASNYPGGRSAFVQAIVDSVGGVIGNTPNSYDGRSGRMRVTTSDFDPLTGVMPWASATAFVYYLNSINYGGFSDWRLPRANRNCTGGACGVSTGASRFINSEFTYFYYWELNGSPQGLFSNIQPGFYWTSTEASNGDTAALFNMATGVQGLRAKPFSTTDGNVGNFGWAVREGQVSTIPTPIPSALLLFLNGIAGLAWCNLRTNRS